MIKFENSFSSITAYFLLGFQIRLKIHRNFRRNMIYMFSPHITSSLQRQESRIKCRKYMAAPSKNLRANTSAPDEAIQLATEYRPARIPFRDCVDVKLSYGSPGLLFCRCSIRGRSRAIVVNLALESCFVHIGISR